MMGALKRKLASWFVGRKVSGFLEETDMPATERRKLLDTIKQVLENVMANRPSVRNEPVVLGGIVTVAVALFSAFGLEISAENLAVTISTVTAGVSFIQRRLVSPTTD